MHIARMTGLARLAALAAVAAAASMLSAAPCEKPCKAETAACIGVRCAGLHGMERRACVETCRGIGGCAPIRTVAWVESRCRSNGQTIRQALRVRRGNCAPATVMDVELPVELGDGCRFYGDYRLGHLSVLRGAFQRLGVSPDGSTVVFELADDATLSPPLVFPPGVETGLYVVRADGRGLRRLGPPSRARFFGLAPDAGSPTGFNYGALLYAPWTFHRALLPVVSWRGRGRESWPRDSRPLGVTGVLTT
jgi:hypothetical protein